jgi:hypothetical protein
MKKINVQQLKIDDNAREFTGKINLSTDEYEGEGVELLWQNCKITLKEISEEVLDLMRDKLEMNGMMANV